MQLKDEIITFTHIFISEFLDFAALASIQYKTVHRYLLNVYNLTFTAKNVCKTFPTCFAINILIYS